MADATRVLTEESVVMPFRRQIGSPSFATWSAPSGWRTCRSVPGDRPAPVGRLARLVVVVVHVQVVILLADHCRNYDRPGCGGRSAASGDGAMEPEQLGGGLVGRVRELGDSVIYVLEGEIDLVNAQALRERLLAVADRVADGYLSLDMGEVTFIDSSGVRHLLALSTTLAEEGVTLTLLNVAPAPERSIRLAGVWELLTLDPSTGG